VRLDEIHAPLGWIGKEVSLLEKQAKARVAFITRLGAGLIPAKDTVIQEGDLLNVFTLEDHADAMHAVLERGPEVA
jgi:trk system potassium uptake protein TrkA